MGFDILSNELGDKIITVKQKGLQRKERRLKIVSEVVEEDGREIRPGVRVTIECRMTWFPQIGNKA